MAVAILGLDRMHKVRSFTSAMATTFHVSCDDLGRSVAALPSIAADVALWGDAQAMLGGAEPIERNFQATGGVWFHRRILLNRTADGAIVGTVVIFTETIRRKQVVPPVGWAHECAGLAALAQCRVVSSASHDLRQPLQALALLQGMLVPGMAANDMTKLTRRIDEALGATTGIIDMLVTATELQAGAVQSRPDDVALDDVLGRFRREFTYHAHAKGLTLRVMPCAALVRTDQRLLHQMVRGLVLDAIERTREGGVLVGCRRRGRGIDIEVWTSGARRPVGDRDLGVDRDHRPDHVTPEMCQEIGHRLAVVGRLGCLLGHELHGQSRTGEGPMFLIKVERSPAFAADLPAVAEIASAMPEAAPGVSQPCPEQPGATIAGQSAPVGKPMSRDLRELANRGSAPAGAILALAGYPVIFVVDDDSNVRDALRCVIEGAGGLAEEYCDATTFLAGYRPEQDGCLLVDVSMPGISGLALLQHLKAAGDRLPTIVITGRGDVPMAVNAMKAGAVDFIEKPVQAQDLLASIVQALEQGRSASERRASHTAAARTVAVLTQRQREVMTKVLAGQPTKNIAADLGLSKRTVDNHRASIMRKTGAGSLPALVRLVVTAGAGG